MAEIRYLFMSLVVVLTLVGQHTCHPHPKALPQQQDDPGVPLFATGKHTNQKTIQQIKRTQSKKSALILPTASRNTPPQTVEQVVESQKDPALTAQTLVINDQTNKRVGGTESKKSTLLSTNALNKDTSRIRGTLLSNSESVLIIQDEDTDGQTTTKIGTSPPSKPRSLSTRKYNIRVIELDGATKSNDQTPVLTAQNNAINAAGLETSSKAIQSDNYGCPQTCKCLVSVKNDITVRACSIDPSPELYELFVVYGLDFFTGINIINARLENYPCEAIMNQTIITSLRLQRNNIKAVSCDLAKFAQLQFVDMSWNELDTFPSDILVAKLNTLLLSHNKLSEVSPSVYQYVENLDLSHNLLKDMPGIDKMVRMNIENIYLSHNLFESIPCNLSEIFMLGTLDLGYNDIREAPCSPSIAMKLVLTHNQLKDVPKQSGNLRELDISYNAVVSVSCDLYLWPRLSVLNMSHNVITEVACNISNLPLTELNLACNTLDMLPCNLSFMRHLSKLNLSHNIMRSGEYKLSEMPLLTSLDVSNSLLTMLPFDPSTIPSLRHLDLSWNRLMTVPTALLRMLSLQKLMITDNAPRMFPNTSLTGPSLQWLSFSHNLIGHVSADTLLSLSNVHEIYLDNNKLNRLPDKIGIVRLAPNNYLHLSGNPWICDCKGLTTRDWIVANNKSIQDVLNVRCYAPSVVKGRPLLSTDRNSFCPDHTSIYVLIGVVALLVACFPLICMIRIRNTVQVYKRKDWEPMYWDEAEDEGKEFDVFVSYCNDDEAYVGEYLIPELEAHGFKICFHRVHFLGGKSIIDNICECIAKSKKMLVFYSKNFIKSNFGMYEFNIAMELDAQNATTRLITIKDKDVDINDLQISHSTYFTTHSYIMREEPRFWDNLIYTLPHHRLGTVNNCSDEEYNDDEEEV